MNQLVETQTEIATPQIFGESDIQIKTAKMYPRNVRKCLEEALELATINPETAESCFYTLERKQKDENGKEVIKYIQGPSVRVSEIIASSWGNIHIGTRIIENDGYYITAEAYCWDLEKNVRVGTQVKRSIRTKGGYVYTQDMQQVTGSAAASIALRNSIFKIIPKTYADSIVEECKKSAVSGNSSEPEEIRIKKKKASVFLRFKELGVEERKILSFFNKKSIDDFTKEDLTNLMGIGTAIKDGHIKIEEAFQVSNQLKSEKLNEELEVRLGSID